MGRPATFEEAFKKVDDLFTDTEQQEAVRTRLLTMPSEKAACLALEGSDAKVQARLKKLAGIEDLRWSKTYGYSTLLANTVGLATPWEQYGLYGIVGASLAFCYRSIRKAHVLMQAVQMTDATVQKEALAFHMLTPLHLENAHVWARRFSVGGIATAVAAPLMWMAWRRAASSDKRRDTA